MILGDLSSDRKNKKMKHYKIAEEFAYGKTKLKGSRMFIDGDIIYSYGYHFPIAIRLNSPEGFKYIFNSSSYSISTARHKSYVKRVIEEENIILETSKMDVFKGVKDIKQIKDIPEFKEIQSKVENNLKVIKEMGLKEGYLLRNKLTGKIVKIKDIHRSFGWVNCNGLKSDWSNINDFEIAKKEMIIKKLVKGD